MRFLIQRVTHASVTVDNNIVGQIGKGLLVFIGVEDTDAKEDIVYLTNKLINLRIFDDANGVMNLSVQDVGGDILAVSQFTLMADTRKGNRPSYIRASKAAFSKPMFDKTVQTIENIFGKKIQTGIFGADMQVELNNAGPVTIWMDSKNK